MWDSQATREGRGVWLWTVTSTVLIFLLELVLFASFVPGDWARTVTQTEQRWLVAAQGPESAHAIQARGWRWYETLFNASGIAPGPIAWSPPLPGCNRAKGWSNLARARSGAGCGDAWTSSGVRSPKRCSASRCSWPGGRSWRSCWSPPSATGGCAGAFASMDSSTRARWRITLRSGSCCTLWISVGLLLFAPIPIPALAIPVLAVITALCVDLVLTNAQKRL